MANNKIDWRELTRNFLLGESDESLSTDDGDGPNNSPGLLNEARDRRLLIVHEAARLKSTFNHAELSLLIYEIQHRS